MLVQKVCGLQEVREPKRPNQTSDIAPIQHESIGRQELGEEKYNSNCFTDILVAWEL